MQARELFYGLSCCSLRTLSLAVRRPSGLREYVSYCLRKSDELSGNGPPCRNPPTPSDDQTITLPAYDSGGGMSFTELAMLARVTKALNPTTVFEFGTYNGLNTSVFMLNASPEARIVTLDLPPDAHASEAVIAGDKQLVANRRLAATPRALGLRNYTQLFCDSMVFDPSPYLNSVDLGLIDAAHDLPHVRNDTIKMAKMMSDRGIVFWHDYGGRIQTGPLTSYLEDLGKQCPLYRISDTQLAWAPALELKKAVCH